MGDASIMEEERRLLYVGMTRAKKHLTLTRAEMRHTAGALTPQMESRFLNELPSDVEKIQAHTAGSSDTKIHDDISAFLHSSPDADDATDASLVVASEGEYVTHPVFGKGIVIQVKGSTLTCVFEGNGVKTIEGDDVSVHQVS